MRLKSEAEILNPKVRQTIIEEILSPENKARKDEAFKRYQCFKDKTDRYVIRQLLSQFDGDTVREMSYCLSNVSLVRKVIDKLARVYSSGVERKVEGDEASTQTLQTLERVLGVNTEMKKANRFLKLQRNVELYIKPCPVVGADGVERFTLKLEPLNPYLYDVIENYYDRTRPMVYVLSDYREEQTQSTSLQAASSGSGLAGAIPLKAKTPGDGKDQTIADTPSDEQDQKTFIWWSDNYHFTTNEEGEILSQGETTNPIGEVPFVSFAVDQDGRYWAQGGGDLVDGGVLVNAMLTNILHISVVQGYGQFWMKGKNIPRNIKVGPTKAILMEQNEGEPEPALGYASANPQLDELRGLVEMYVALLLTTNNLSTAGVSTQLNGGMSAPSGVALMIDKAESREDVSDQEQLFRDKEPHIWRKVSKWLTAYGDDLVEELKALRLPEVFDVSLRFHEPQAIMSEAEKLQAIKLRKELGINTMIDLIMKDQPDLTREQAEAKLKEILEEKMARVTGVAQAVGQPPLRAAPDAVSETTPQAIGDEGEDDESQSDQSL